MLVWAQIAGVSRPGIEILVDRRSRYFDFNPNVDPLACVITVEARSNDAGAHHRWNEYQGTETRHQPNIHVNKYKEFDHRVVSLQKWGCLPPKRAAQSANRVRCLLLIPRACEKVSVSLR